MQKKNKAPAPVKDPQATFAPPPLAACPGCQSASRPEVTSPTHTTKQSVPGNSAAPCLLLSTCSARGHCLVLVPRNKRKEQSADAIYGRQLSRRRGFTSFSLSSSAQLVGTGFSCNQSCLTELLESEAQSTGEPIGSCKLNDYGRTAAAADKSLPPPPPPPHPPTPQPGGRVHKAIGGG